MPSLSSFPVQVTRGHYYGAPVPQAPPSKTWGDPVGGPELTAGRCGAKEERGRCASRNVLGVCCAEKILPFEVSVTHTLLRFDCRPFKSSAGRLAPLRNIIGLFHSCGWDPVAIGCWRPRGGE